MSFDPSGNTKWDGFCVVSWMGTVAQQINMIVCRLGVDIRLDVSLDKVKCKIQDVE